MEAEEAAEHEHGFPSVGAAASTIGGVGNNKICKIVIQQCIRASLRFDTDAIPVAIGPGMVVFVCFLQGASHDRIKGIG